MIFIRGETIICSVEIKDSDGTLVDPETSMKITIADSTNGAEVDNQAMSKDSTGKYHYDWTSTSANLMGVYKIKYIATNGTRISIQKDIIELE